MHSIYSIDLVHMIMYKDLKNPCRVAGNIYILHGPRAGPWVPGPGPDCKGPGPAARPCEMLMFHMYMYVFCSCCVDSRVPSLWTK
jgi:hypothetical protein